MISSGVWRCNACGQIVGGGEPHHCERGKPRPGVANHHPFSEFNEMFAGFRNTDEDLEELKRRVREKFMSSNPFEDFGASVYAARKIAEERERKFRSEERGANQQRQDFYAAWNRAKARQRREKQAEQQSERDARYGKAGSADRPLTFFERAFIESFAAGEPWFSLSIDVRAKGSPDDRAAQEMVARAEGLGYRLEKKMREPSHTDEAFMGVRTPRLHLLLIRKDAEGPVRVER